MPERSESESRKLLRRLRDTLAEPGAGQARLNRITHIIADSMRTEVCSIYLFRDPETLELCATEGLNPASVHQTRLRLGEGLVGRVAKSAVPVNTGDAPGERGFRYMPETGEEIYSSFLGVPIQRVGERLGVLVVQSKQARQFSDDEVYALEVVAMVLAEMAELGAFVGEGAAHPGAPPAGQWPISGDLGAGRHVRRAMSGCTSRVSSSPTPSADDPEAGTRPPARAAIDHPEGQTVDSDVRARLEDPTDKHQRDVLETYRMFANSRSWLPTDRGGHPALGLSAEAAVEKEQNRPPAPGWRTGPPIPICANGSTISTTCRIACLRHPVRAGQRNRRRDCPRTPFWWRATSAPAELLDYGRSAQGHRARGGIGRQPCRDRRPRAGRSRW